MNTKACFYQLTTLHQPGGESTVASSITPSGKVSIRLTGGDIFDQAVKLEGQVLGVNLNSDDVFGPSCFEADCFVGGGIWTTAVKTEVSKVEDGITYYWLPGSFDPEGNLWFVEVGTLCPSTGEFDLRQSVAIQSEGWFYSLKEVGTGIKTAVLKRATRTSLECVQQFIGNYPIPDRLTRYKTGYCLGYNAQDQRTDIEAIALSILGLLHTKYKHAEQNQQVYYFNDEVDKTIVRLVEENFSRLSRLVDTLSVTKRVGSIPKWVATYSEPTQLYGDWADSQYANPIVRVFSEGCFSEGCFEVGENKLLVSREVRTRAIAWLVYALVSYSASWKSDTYLALLSQLSSHLLNQVDPKLQLPIEGWTHTIALKDSQPILEYKLSTAVSVVLAFLKLYEFTEQEVYLEYGVDVYESILEKLYSIKTQKFLHSLDQPEATTESLTYGLLLSTFLKRADLTEATLKEVGTRLKQSYSELSLPELLAHPQSLSMLTDSAFDSADIQDISSYNLMLVELLGIDLAEKFQLPTGAAAIADQFESNAHQEEINSLQLTSRCLLEPSRLALEQVYTLPVRDAESLIFQRSFVYDKVRQMWPLHYSWVSEKALSPQGNLGKLLKSLSKSLATWFVAFNRTIRGTKLVKADYLALDAWGKDTGVIREVQESNSALRERITDHLSKPAALTETSIIKALARIGAKAEISEPWKKIQGFNTFMRNPFRMVLGESYYSGENYATANLYELKVFRPIVDRIIQLTQSKTAAGVKVIYSEVLAFEADFDAEVTAICNKVTLHDRPESCYLLQETDYRLLTEDDSRLVTCGPNTCYILQEDGSRLLTEDGSYLVTCNTSCYLLQENDYKLLTENNEYLITCDLSDLFNS